MKMVREHLVPLSTPAAAIVRRRLRSTNVDVVFPGMKFGGALAQNTMIFACYRMGYRSRRTVHRFRGLASTWANDAECYKSDWIELALRLNRQSIPVELQLSDRLLRAPLIAVRAARGSTQKRPLELSQGIGLGDSGDDTALGADRGSVGCCCKGAGKKGHHRADFIRLDEATDQGKRPHLFEE